MNEVLRRDAEAVVRAAIDAVRPDAAVRRALARIALAEDLYLAAVGRWPPQPSGIWTGPSGAGSC